ncbi:TPA: hypothetical protein DF272_06290 [Candidatus Falkowbacteria bacterium]|nr:hypothetical protein [Candidatus Falkowbacteria bacterium]
MKSSNFFETLAFGILIIMTGLACNSNPNHSDEMKPTESVKIVPAAKATKSKQELTTEKLQEVQTLKSVLQQKETTLAATLTQIDAEINANVIEIKTEKSRTGLIGFDQAIKDEKIRGCLEAIQTANAYIQIVNKHIHLTQAGTVELSTLEKKLRLDAIMFNSLDEDEINNILADLDLVITRIQPDSNRLVLTDEKTDLKPLSEIYDHYIRPEEAAKDQQRQLELQRQKDLQDQQTALQRQKELEEQRRIEQEKRVQADLSRIKVVRPAFHITIEQLGGHFRFARFSYSGKYIALINGSSTTQILINETGTENIITSFQERYIGNLTDVVWSTDDQRLAIIDQVACSATDTVRSTFRIWAIESGETIFTAYESVSCADARNKLISWTDHGYVVHQGSCISPDSCYSRLGYSKAFASNLSISFRANSSCDKDSKSFYYGESGKIRLLDFTTNTVMVELNECPDASDPTLFATECNKVQIVRLNYANHRLATLVKDQTGLRVSVWNTVTNSLLSRLPLVTAKTHMWWHGQQLLIANGDKIIVLDPEKNTQTPLTLPMSLPEHSVDLKFWSPTNPLYFLNPTTENPALSANMAKAHGVYYVKDYSTQKTVAALLCGGPLIQTNFDWSHDGRYLLARSDGWRFCIWDMRQLN